MTLAEKPGPIPLVGLTGGIGSGKSLVSDCFNKLGIVVIDTDVISHRLTAENGAALPLLRQAFGNDIFNTDGSLNRIKLRNLVFDHPEHRKKLEQILHPMIADDIDSEITSLSQKTPRLPYLIIEIPLLAETGFMKDRLSRVIVVHADQKAQISRVMARNNMPKENILAIINAQATVQERLSLADDIIDNNTDTETVKRQVDEINKRYRTLFSAR